MTISAHSRGHKIVYFKDSWIYANDYSIFNDSRPCIKCGRYPTKEGYDACIGKLNNIKSACCGHGIEKPILIKR